jgi:cyclopropane fatty-acyl-phospholipid synthase-like methyltransferase
MTDKAQGDEGLTEQQDDWDAHWSGMASAVERNPAQKFRHRFLVSLLKRENNPGMRLLDIGSGQGDFAVAIHKALPGSQILGLELSATGVRISEAKVPSARFVQCNLYSDIPEPRDADWATHAACSEVLEHLDEPVKLLQAAREYMQPGCRLFITVPSGPMSAFDRHIGHRQHFTPESLRRVVEQAGFRTSKVFRAGFPFFNLYRLAIISRGDKLAKDLSADQRPGTVASLAMWGFDMLFRLALRDSPLGWQLVAVATMDQNNSLQR